MRGACAKFLKVRNSSSDVSEQMSGYNIGAVTLKASLKNP